MGIILPQELFRFRQKVESQWPVSAEPKTAASAGFRQNQPEGTRRILTVKLPKDNPKDDHADPNANRDPGSRMEVIAPDLLCI